MKTIVFSTLAAKQFDNLPPPAQMAIENGLARYAIDGRGDVKALTGRPGHRLRIGEYRVIFSEDGAAILAITLGRRDTNIYA